MGFEHTFTWDGPAESVIATGTFDDWKSSTPLTKGEDGKFSAKLDLPYGTKVTYKYVVDGQWLDNPNEPHETDGSGNVNNVFTPPAEAPVVTAAVAVDETHDTTEADVAVNGSPDVVVPPPTVSPTLPAETATTSLIGESAKGTAEKSDTPLIAAGGAAVAALGAGIVAVGSTLVGGAQSAVSAATDSDALKNAQATAADVSAKAGETLTAAQTQATEAVSAATSKVTETATAAAAAVTGGAAAASTSATETADAAVAKVSETPLGAKAVEAAGLSKPTEAVVPTPEAPIVPPTKALVTEPAAPIAKEDVIPVVPAPPVADAAATGASTGPAYPHAAGVLTDPVLPKPIPGSTPTTGAPDTVSAPPTVAQAAAAEATPPPADAPATPSKIDKRKSAIVAEGQKEIRQRKSSFFANLKAKLSGSPKK